MSSRKTWLTNTKRASFVTGSITESKHIFVSSVTSGTQNTDVTGDISNKTPSARDAAEVTHGCGSRG